ncbi:MAG TPA: glutamate-5-semialdehyde dehydrogenase [Woeseiaceae bacterium]|nr:glutamate-5-semialdehyde dehydrogenase [Woeseiaceae bacterium]
MSETEQAIAALMSDLGVRARAAADELARSTAAQRNGALRAAAVALRDNRADILEANRLDVEAARSRKLSDALLDRLALDDERIQAMASGLETIAEMRDPVGRVMEQWQRPNGLTIQRVSVPLGVIGIVYESRPNVTADAAALCLKSGNAVILRGGSDSFHSSREIHASLVEGLAEAGLSAGCVQMVNTRDRAAVGYLLSSMSQWLDVVVPRGGKSLVKRVQDEARVPVIGHLEGLCHVYLHASADARVARDIVVNAKMRRTGVCGAAETLLVDQSVAARLLPDICAALVAAGCEIRGDAEVARLVPGVEAASPEDWTTEYLDAILAIRVVANIDAAIEHIATFGSGHTDSIVATDVAAAEQFLREVDSSIVLHNASTQFADGGEFGMGAEIGIATGRVHARGPVGAEQLCSYKYVVRGTGQTRP